MKDPKERMIFHEESELGGQQSFPDVLARERGAG